jgi:prepilin-type N-terminal cleavage/methylation domain-containing protein
MKKTTNNSSTQFGFSLLELIIAMTVTLVIVMIATTLLASSFKVRNRENQRSSAIADAQRALNIMSREIANAGYGLSTNGIVAGDSGLNQIRVRSDSAPGPDGKPGNGQIFEPGEDVKYVLVNDANGSFIVRMDLQPTQTTGLIANRIDGLRIHYYDKKVTYSIGNCQIGNCDITNVKNSDLAPQGEVVALNTAKYIVLVLSVTLPAVGAPGSAGYQPASATQLVSTVTLRNATLGSY